MARCFVDDGWPTMTDDIGAFAIHSGWAVPTDHAGELIMARYLMEYVFAKAARRGAWNGSTVFPEVWRGNRAIGG